MKRRKPTESQCCGSCRSFPDQGGRFRGCRVQQMWVAAEYERCRRYKVKPVVVTS